MTAKREGSAVNIRSIGVLTNAALDEWSRCASSEFADMGISFTTINMPRVRTATIAQACIFKPVRVVTRLGITGQVMHELLPRIAPIAMNTSTRMLPDSLAAKGAKPSEKAAKPQLSAEAVAMQQLLNEIHF